MNELLDTAQLSPRLSWLRDHNLITRDYQDRANGGYAHHSLNTDRWLCANRAMTQYASGATEESAEAAYATRYNLPWYKLAGWNGAMSGVYGVTNEIRLDGEEPVRLQVAVEAINAQEAIELANKEWDL